MISHTKIYLPNTRKCFMQNSQRKAISILMIDDHPSQIEGYKVILKYNTLGLRIQVTTCYNSETAYWLVTNSHTSDFDLVFLDFSLPAYPEKNIQSGEDLGMVIKKHMPNSRIVVLTSHSETFLLYNIVKKINPAGILVKSDFSAEDLLDAFNIIVGGEQYQSPTVKQCIKELLAKEAYLDTPNRQIITLLAQGIKTKSLPEHLKMSLSAIEKRKAQVKDYLCVEKGTDEDIVREAKRLGFI